MWFGCLVFRFWEVKVVIDVEIVVMGRRVKVIMRWAVVWVLIIIVLKVLIEDCKIILLIDIIEFIKFIVKFCFKRLVYKVLFYLKCLSWGKSFGIFLWI